MGTGFFALGILCFIYYFTIIWYTKRWNTTFSIFWVFFGLLQIGLSVLVDIVPTWADYIIGGIAIICTFVFVAVEIIILCSMVTVPPKKLKYIIILGARVRGEVVTEALKRRLDRGLRYLQENPETMVVLSGGKGRGEDITEALAMSRYLQSCGVEPERIILEEKSTTTQENLEFCKEVVESEKDKIGLVTNNFHMYRAMRSGKKAGYKKVYGIAASCNPVVFLNYVVREFFGVLKMYLAK